MSHPDFELSEGVLAIIVAYRGASQRALTGYSRWSSHGLNFLFNQFQSVWAQRQCLKLQ